MRNKTKIREKHIHVVVRYNIKVISTFLYPHVMRMKEIRDGSNHARCIEYTEKNYYRGIWVKKREVTWEVKFWG